MHPQPAESMAVMARFRTIIIYKSLQLACDRGSAGFSWKRNDTCSDGRIRPSRDGEAKRNLHKINGKKREEKRDKER